MLTRSEFLREIIEKYLDALKTSDRRTPKPQTAGTT